MPVSTLRIIDRNHNEKKAIYSLSRICNRGPIVVAKRCGPAVRIHRVVASEFWQDIGFLTVECVSGMVRCRAGIAGFPGRRHRGSADGDLQELRQELRGSFHLNYREMFSAFQIADVQLKFRRSHKPFNDGDVAVFADGAEPGPYLSPFAPFDVGKEHGNSQHLTIGYSGILAGPWR